MFGEEARDALPTSGEESLPRCWRAGPLSRSRDPNTMPCAGDYNPRFRSPGTEFVSRGELEDGVIARVRHAREEAVNRAAHRLAVCRDYRCPVHDRHLDSARNKRWPPPVTQFGDTAGAQVADPLRIAVRGHQVLRVVHLDGDDRNVLGWPESRPKTVRVATSPGLSVATIGLTILRVKAGGRHRPLVSHAPSRWGCLGQRGGAHGIHRTSPRGRSTRWVTPHPAGGGSKTKPTSKCDVLDLRVHGAACFMLPEGADGAGDDQQ